MKIVFLDIDGVLNRQNPDGELEFIEGSCRRSGRTSHSLSPALINNLNYLTTYTGAKIVVSSTWRLGETLESLQLLLNSVGVTAEVVGVTGVDNSRIRGVEILQWIKDNIEDAYYNYKDYVILDDDSDMLLWQKDNFVQTDGLQGLTRGKMWEAINILSKEN